MLLLPFFLHILRHGGGESSKIFVGAIGRSWSQVWAPNKIKGIATADMEVGDGGVGDRDGPQITRFGPWRLWRRRAKVLAPNLM